MAGVQGWQAPSDLKEDKVETKVVGDALRAITRRGEACFCRRRVIADENIWQLLRTCE